MSVAQTKTRTDPRRSNMESAEIRGGSLKTGRMKIGVIGAGAVGSACLLSSILRGTAREIVVVNRDRKRARAVVTDMQYGAALSSVVQIRDGDYADLTGAALVMITVGMNEKAGGATNRNDPAGRPSRTLISTGKSFPRSSGRYRRR
jgi:malate/lactate dehydrogenase